MENIDNYDVMIDLETAATSRDALVLSAAAQEFRIERGSVHFGQSKVWVPDMRIQVAKGRVVDPKTIKWWQGQDSQARIQWTHPVLSCVCDFHKMMEGISQFCLEAGVITGGRSIWAHGTVFDIGILEDCYEQCSMKAPWPYNAVRDVRTIVRELPVHSDYITPDFMNEKGLVPHDPLSDCILQIWNLAEYLPQGNPHTVYPPEE